jgi:hypothetical protein
LITLTIVAVGGLVAYRIQRSRYHASIGLALPHAATAAPLAEGAGA